MSILVSKNADYPNLIWGILFFQGEQVFNFFKNAKTKPISHNQKKVYNLQDIFNQNRRG